MNEYCYDCKIDIPMNKYLVSDIWEDIGSVYFRHQLLYKFENGYGASVVRCRPTRLHDDDLWELAVVKWLNEPDKERYHLCYDTNVTDDVIGDLLLDEIEPILNKIKNLKGDDHA